MPLPAGLIRAYSNADYVVFGEMRDSPELLLRIGGPNPDLDALLEADGAATAAYLTAANPRGKGQSAFRNRIAFHSLRKLLKKKRYRHCAGEGRDPQGLWTPEPSVLVVGIGRADAEALGRALGQNAIVFIEKGRAPELVALA